MRSYGAKFKHILFPVDFSERSNNAVSFVETMARAHNARVTLLAVTYPHFAGAAEGNLIIDSQELLDITKQQLSEAFPGRLQNQSVARVVELGDPAPCIVDFTNANNVDLIMMPTHGYGPFRELLLGSVTAKVLHDAACPVWTTPHTARDTRPEHLAMKNILCAVDTSPASAALMRWAADFAGHMGGTLRVVHAVPGMEGWPARQMNAEFETQMREIARRKIDEMEKVAGIDVHVCVGAGAVADVVAEEAKQHKAEVLIIARGALTQTLGRLRTHAHAIIRKSPCPVVSV